MPHERHDAPEHHELTRPERRRTGDLPTGIDLLADLTDEERKLLFETGQDDESSLSDPSTLLPMRSARRTP